MKIPSRQKLAFPALNFCSVCWMFWYPRMAHAFRLLLLASLLCLPRPGHAATNIVLSTDNLQQKIDAAVAGDVMVLQGGAYFGNITITKPLSFVRAGTNTVTWPDPVSIQTTGSVCLLQLTCSSAITASGVTSLLIQDCSLSSSLNVTGAGVTIKRSAVLGEINFTSADVTLLRLTGCSAITANANAGSGKRFVMAQSTGIGSVSTTGYDVRLAYNQFAAGSHVDGDVLYVGNRVWSGNRVGPHYAGISCTRCKIHLYNNSIDQATLFWSPSWPWDELDGVLLGSCQGEVINNYITGYVTDGVLHGVHASGGPIIVKANVFYLSWQPGKSSSWVIDFEGATGEVSYCYGYSSSGVTGANAFQCLWGSDPGMTRDTVALNSPCINAGPPEPFYNDADGTRNDMGWRGGPYYQANGMTTDKPLLFWMMPAQKQIWKGTQSTLNVEAAATAGH